MQVLIYFRRKIGTLIPASVSGRKVQGGLRGSAVEMYFQKNAINRPNGFYFPWGGHESFSVGDFAWNAAEWNAKDFRARREEWRVATEKDE